MAQDPHAPIYSSLGEDLEQQENVDRFVIGLAEAMDRIQDAQATQDLGEVASRCLRLARQAREHGYGTLADLADATLRASEEDKPQLVLDHLRLMTQISCRVRMGHRGAA